MLDDPYFQRPPPKSTGREHFNQSWLESHIRSYQTGTGQSSIAAVDIQRTLLELTAVSITRAVQQYGKGYSRLAVCGGGAHNAALMSRLQQSMPDLHVCSSDELGMAPDWVEAATFAWLAANTIENRTVNSGQLTGARHPVILGGIYPGSSDRKG